MKALLYRSLRKFGALFGRSAGVAASAVAASSSFAGATPPALVHPTPSPATKEAIGSAHVKTPHDFGQDWHAIVRRETSHTLAIAYAPAPAGWPLVTIGAHDQSTVAVAAPSRGIPGWLTARAKREAALARRTSRPLDRAASHRPRPGNQPARRAAKPRKTSARTVVWMARRPSMIA